MISYPLMELLQLRQASVRRLEQQLAIELAAVRVAQDRVAEHRARQLALETSIATEQRRQHESAVRGQVLAHELVQGTSHLARQRSDLERLSAATTRALADLESCSAASRATQSSLARSRRQLAAVQRHHLRYVKSVQKRQEARMEEDTAEAWQALRTKQKPEGRS